MTRRLRGVAAAILAMMLAASPAAATAPSDVAAIEQRMASDPEHALTLAQDMYGRLPPTEAQGARGATLLWLKGEAQMRVADPRAGLRTLDRALAIARQARAPASLVANITLARGSALTDAGRISDALRTLQQAHRMFVALHDQRSQARALILVALLHASARDHAAALRYFDQIDDLYSDDPGLAMAVDSGRGNALLALGRYPEAQREFRGALTAARKLRNAPVMAQSLGDLAVAQLRAGDLAGASRSVARAMTIARDEEAAAIRPQLLGAAADVALHQGDIARARHLITQRFAGVDLAHTMIAERHAHDTAYRTYVAAGDPAAALPHLAAVKRLDEQATAIARSTSAALASARFDYTNQELRIARLKAAGLSRTIDFQRATARTQRLILYGVAGATLLIILLLGTGLALLGRSRNRERAANRDLAASNARLEKLSRAKTDFLATTSHEIRTPLNGILGMTQVMIADPHLDPATRERLGVVETAGQTMRALVDDILDMAKIETGRLTIETAPFDLHATIDAAARLWREPAEAKGLSFTVDVAGAPRWIVGDAARLRQIVFNLLSNAVKFTDAGEVSVVAASDGGMLRIEVTDSGIGISAAAQRIIFESFRQADASTTRRFGGTGLGLAICRNVAQAMGGDVTVASRAGQGSRFTLDLPLVPAAAPEEEIVTGGLLIVERHPIARAMLRSLFANHGPVTFSDGDRAVAEATRRHPAAILVDAGTFGRKPDALRALTAIAPVILLTEEITEQERHALFAAGITKVIEKPVSKKALVAALDELPLQKVGNAA